MQTLKRKLPHQSQAKTQSHTITNSSDENENKDFVKNEHANKTVNINVNKNAMRIANGWNTMLEHKEKQETRNQQPNT